MDDMRAGEIMGARPVKEVQLKESDVKEELNGWFRRRCEQNEADLRKEAALYGMRQAFGPTDTSKMWAQQKSAEADAWAARAAAARQGRFLYDVAALRDPVLCGDRQVRALRDRCSQLGLVDYEEATRPTVGPGSVPPATLGQRW